MLTLRKGMLLAACRTFAATAMVFFVVAPVHGQAAAAYGATSVSYAVMPSHEGGTSGNSATSPQAAAPSSGAKPAAPAVNKASTGPLQANGLIARALRQADQWIGHLGAQIDELKTALTGLVMLLARSGGRISDANRQLLLYVAEALMGSFVAGLAAEWVVRRLLKRSFRWLIARADRAQTNEATEDARQAKPEAAAQKSKDQPASDEVLAGTRPVRDGVALVAVHRDGVERVEEVPVGRSKAPHVATASRGDTKKPAGGMHRVSKSHQPSKYIHTLRRMMYAFGGFALDLFPLVIFLLVAALVLHALAVGDARVHEVSGDFVSAYAVTRVTMAVERLFVSPLSAGMRVLQASEETALVLQRWGRVIVALVAFGSAIGDAAQTLGATPQGRMAFIKIVALVVHIVAVILVLRLRKPVRHAIAANPGATGVIAASRNWLARSWMPFAVVLILGEWVVWALGVEDGFPKLIHFIVVTAVILIAARIVIVLLLGLLGRAFHIAPGSTSTSDKPDVRLRLTQTYYPPVKALVSFLITIFAVIALLQAWGVDTVDWFSHGTIGRGLTSAAATILAAAFIAIVIWEASSISIERRIDLWSQHGDTMRAARLRTLLPMLRTGLFICVVLVVGLTALNEIGVNTTPLLASASIVGVALGFGSQKLVQDFITGIFLLMENAMQVGDWVTVAGVSGTVEALSVRTVRLRGGDGSLYTVPFSAVTTVNNTHRGLGNAAVTVSVSREDDIERAIAALKSIGTDLREDPSFSKLILKDIEVWGVDAMDGSKITLIGQMQCTDNGRWGVQREINARIVKRFREKNIDLANPRTNLLLTPDAIKPSPSGEGEAEQSNSS